MSIHTPQHFYIVLWLEPERHHENFLQGNISCLIIKRTVIKRIRLNIIFTEITASYAVTITDYTNQITHFDRDNEISFLLIICWTGKEILNQITNEESK